jgi:Calcineurin-like phosphoesterase
LRHSNVERAHQVVCACDHNVPVILNRTRVYVVGDIHRRSDLLDQVVAHISRDLEVNPTSDCVTVTLGDYIDRGPDSRGVLDRLMHNPFPTELVALKGNHEALLEMFLDDPAVAEDWRRLGGRQRRLFPLSCRGCGLASRWSDNSQDLLWIRDEFLKRTADFGRNRSRTYADRTARDIAESDQYR